MGASRQPSLVLACYDSGQTSVTVAGLRNHFDLIGYCSSYCTHTVEIKTAILGYTALSLCSHQPAAIGVEFACGQHCNPESGITGSASSVQGVVLFRDLKLRFWETDVAWRDVTDVFGF